MTDTPWTPGPWTVEAAEPPDIEFPWWIAAHHVTAAVAEVLTARDARLIAAAPEMADVLSVIASVVPDPDDYCGHCGEVDPEHAEDCCYTMAVALLSRIRGEA